LGKLRRATTFSLSRQSLPGQVGWGAGEVAEREVAVRVAAQNQLLGTLALAQGDGHRNHPLDRERLSEVQAAVRKAMDREIAGVRLVLQHEQHGLAAPVGPFHQKRHVQLPKPIAEAFLERIFPDRDDVDAAVLTARLHRRRRAGSTPG
jgi:hypothetical protein